MAVSYKLVQKRNPVKPDDPKKWYAVPKSATAQTGKQMTKAATENTTVAPIEMEASLDLLAKYVPNRSLRDIPCTFPVWATCALRSRVTGRKTSKTSTRQQ